MKKYLISFLLLLSIVVISKKIYNSDYSSAKIFANEGNYKSFYSEIKNELNNQKAFFLLMEYFLQAVKDSDIEEVKYYLKQNPNLINESSEYGYRAIDVALLDNKTRLKTLKLLMKYKPNLDYLIKYYPNEVTPLQLLVVKQENYKSLSAIKLFIDNGADVNFYTQNGYASISPLLYSYLNENIKVFEMLLKNGAKLQNTTPVNKKNKNDILSYITASYALELANKGIDLASFYQKPLNKKTKIALASQSYRIIHQRNLEYLNLINKYKKLQEVSHYGAIQLAEFYTAINEIEGIKLLLLSGICNKKQTCKILKNIAIKHNHRSILNILSKN